MVHNCASELRLGGDLTVPIVATNFVQQVAAADRCGARVHAREDRRILAGQTIKDPSP